MGDEIKLPEGEMFVSMTTTNYGTLYVMSSKALYRVDMRAFGREMVPVTIKREGQAAPARIADTPDRAA